MLEVRGLTVAYRGRVVLDGVNLVVRAGELVGLIGPNAAGKSTLLRAVAGTVPYTGRITVCGRNQRELSRTELARLVAVVPQTPSLPPLFTVAEVVMLGRTPYLNWLGWERPQDWAAVGRALELTELEALADRPVGQLSGGERQRAVIARALAQEPKILLLDEPLNNLDIAHQVRVIRLVRRLTREQGLAAVLTAHDLTLVAQAADRVILLDRGRVVAEGPPAAVVDRNIIKEVYGTDVTVWPDPFTGRPVALVRVGGPEEAAGDSSG
jgi:iron complex transport system ATP-binding protein